MVTRAEAITRAQEFVLRELGYGLEVLNTQHVTRELLREALDRPSLAAPETEQAAILNRHEDYWAVSFAVQLPDGTLLDSPAVVRVTDADSVASWLAESSQSSMR